MNLGQGSDQKEGEYYKSLYFKRILVSNNETKFKKPCTKICKFLVSLCAPLGRILKCSPKNAPYLKNNV